MTEAEQAILERLVACPDCGGSAAAVCVKGKARWICDWCESESPVTSSTLNSLLLWHGATPTLLTRPPASWDGVKGIPYGGPK